MSEPQIMTGEAAIGMLVAIRLDGFVTGYASAILTDSGPYTMTAGHHA